MSNKSEMVVRELLEIAGVQVNGPNPWDIQVHDSRLYDPILRDGERGVGETYMDGWWGCLALVQMMVRVLKTRLETRIQGNWKTLFHILGAKIFNRPSSTRAFKIGEHHYDLGNGLYEAMLDKRLNYTCSYWKNASNLDDAQEAKLELVCRKIGLKTGMKV
jgi:cyclopropane-fatty-acyl-phospholipid synthase